MADPKKAKRTPAPRYGIAEWYGRNVITMSPQEREQSARIAVEQAEKSTNQSAPPCPFLSRLIPNAPCSKAGGVCSIRKFKANLDGYGEPIVGEKVVTVCPQRLLQPLEEVRSLFTWIAERLLDISNPTIVKETPFLRKVIDPTVPSETKQDLKEEAEEEQKKAGRIDWILVDPATLSANELKWCAVETQALYFSGRAMVHEFRAHLAAPDKILFPTLSRRPDYRSSGPKRLWPQLDVKVPVLRGWGNKVAVVIDSYFLANMNRLPPSDPKAKTDRDRRSNAEVIWFIVDYDDSLHLKADTVIYASLESSRTALNATEPLSETAFTEDLKKTIASGKRNKVFRVSE